MMATGPASRAGWSVLAAAALWGTTGTAAALAPHGSSALAVGAGGMGGGGLLLALRAGPERVVDGRRLSGRWAAATALAIAGAGVLGVAGRPSGGPAGPAVAAGVILGLVAGAAYAGYAFIANRLMVAGREPRAVMGATFGLAAVPLLAVLAAAGSSLVTSGRGLGVLGYLAVVPMAAGYALFGRGLGTIPSSVATALSLLEPTVAAVLAELVLGQRLDWAGWAGIALVAGGVVGLAFSTRPDRAAIPAGV